jgi:hypothetical protein
MTIISRIETIWIDEHPNTCWVRLHTDDVPPNIINKAVLDRAGFQAKLERSIENRTA